MSINTYWSVQEGSIGHDIRIFHDRIQWSSYDIPETRHSGGGSQDYALGDLYKGSPLYLRLVPCFGEAKVGEMLFALGHPEESPEIMLKRNAKALCLEWLNNIPESISVPSEPWADKENVTAGDYSGGDFSAAETIGIKILPEKPYFKLSDLSSQKQLAEVLPFFPFHYGMRNGVRIICTYQELIILHSDKALLPFSSVSQAWKDLQSEISLPYISDQHIYVRLCLDRLVSYLGDFIIQLDYEGNILGKRTRQK